MASNQQVRLKRQSKVTPNPPVRSKLAPMKRSAGSNHRAATSVNGDDEDSIRVRVAVRLRPKNVEDLASGVDFDDCVELQPELKRLKLKRNNWSSESFIFDEVFTEGASQKRVYDVVAKPVVDSVLNGYNGTVMAYGQTGTGKTYTVGQLGTDDPSKRGIMVRAVEDIIAATSSASDIVSVSYLQLYLESIQDLLAPEKHNIPIVEDPKTGEVSFPGAALVKVQGLDHFMQLLQIGEANRHAANTKLNTNSSRSHAILMVHIQRSVKAEEKEISCLENNKEIDLAWVNGVPMMLRSKLLIVDLAGSERIDKSGSEGVMLEEAKSINLSLTSLGKCINALAENSPHIPTRDSKLTRLLRDSFGGSAKTSLIITIGPSTRHHPETASTIMFGQRAMKIVNMVKLKEEFDYKSLCRNLEYKVDHLTAEIERQQKLRDDDKEQMERKLNECQKSLDDEKKSFAAMSESLEKENSRLESEIKIMLAELNLQKDQNDLMCDEVARLETSLERSKHHQIENATYQKVLADTTQMYENKIAELLKHLEDERSHYERAQEELAGVDKLLLDHGKLLQGQKEMNELGQKLHEMCKLHEEAVKELQSLKVENKELLSGKAILHEELQSVQKKLFEEEKERKRIAEELVKMQKLVSENCIDLEAKKQYMKENIGPIPSGLGSLMSFHKSNQSRETISSQRSTIAKIFEEVGLQKILSLLKSEELDVQIHAVKVVANLATEDINQEKIVEEGGLDALLMLLESSENMTIHRIASGAIANLAMNEMNQTLIMSKGGARLLANIASKTDDPQTLRMVAGAIANLCGNEKLHVMLNEDGGTKALLGMVKSGHSDVIAQIARGMANFAKCESRGINQGHRKGRSLLIKDGALPWLIANSAITSASTRRHVELALCHLAQNEGNAQDFVSSGAMKELIRISRESNKEDIRNLARKTLNTSPTYIAEMQKLSSEKR